MAIGDPAALGREAMIAYAAQDAETLARLAAEDVEARGAKIGAARLFRAACDLDYEPACRSLASMAGSSTASEAVAAAIIVHFDALCAADPAAGRLSAGVAYFSARRPLFDLARAVEFLRRGCDLDDPLACGRLGDTFYRGEGAPKNSLLAARYYALACDAGQSISQGAGVRSP